MKQHYIKSDFESKFAYVNAIVDKDTDEFFYKYMKIIISFGRPTKLSQKGYDKGLEIYEKWKKEDITREENMLLGFLLSDVALLEENPKMTNDLKTIYNQMITTYKPDFQYLQDFSQNHLLNNGYVEPNANYMKTVEQMFNTDFVLPDADSVRMIRTGEMPIYDEVKVCPYCGKQFGVDVEELFKHVKSNHDKK